MSDGMTVPQFREALLAAARSATAATFDMLEHHRDTQNDKHMSRFQNETCEILAEALGIALDVELAAIDRAITAALSDMAAKALRDEQAMLNQLKGAVSRYIEGWAG